MDYAQYYQYGQLNTLKNIKNETKPIDEWPILVKKHAKLPRLQIKFINKAKL